MAPLKICFHDSTSRLFTSRMRFSYSCYPMLGGSSHTRVWIRGVPDVYLLAKQLGIPRGLGITLALYRKGGLERSSLRRNHRKSLERIQRSTSSILMIGELSIYYRFGFRTGLVNQRAQHHENSGIFGCSGQHLRGSFYFSFSLLFGPMFMAFLWISLVEVFRGVLVSRIFEYRSAGCSSS